MKLKPSLFSFILLVVITGGACGMLSTTSIAETIGANVFKLTSVYNTVAPYQAPKSMDIDRAFFKTYLNSEMCVGQEIKFKTSIDPIDSEETMQEYSKAWWHPEAIDVLDKQKGIVKGIKASSTILQVFYPLYTNSKYIQFRVREIKDYDFDHLYIDNMPINYSFETLDNHKDFHTNGITLNLKQGCSSRIYYDKYYFPKTDKTNFKFKSSDPSVATINETTGDVEAVGPGTCKISGEGSVVDHPEKIFSTNEITVNVESFSPIKIKRFGCDLNEVNQYISYKLDDHLLFYPNNCTDKTFDLKVTKENGIILKSDFSYNSNTTEIDFKKPGKYNLEFTSHSSTEEGTKYKINKNIVVKENKPVKIASDLTWTVIGNKYDSQKLGLKLYFENGWKYLEESDLEYNRHNIVRDRRASHSTNGLCDGKITTYKAIKAGTFKYTYTCKYDTNIKYNMVLTTNVYAKPQYINVCQNIGLIFVYVGLVLLSLYLLCVQINNKFLYILTAAGFACIITIMTILIYPLTGFSIGCIISLNAAVLIISLIRLTTLNNKSIKLISED